jgi:predicted dehydrogenase
MKERLPRVLFVGCGEHGTGTLLPAVVSLGAATVVGVCDADAERAETTARRYAVPTAGTDVERLLDELEPDAVVMAGPPQLHSNGGLAALEYGCDLFVEKPPGLVREDVECLAAAARERAQIGMVGHNLRYSAAWRHACEAARGLGSIEHLTVSYHASGPTGSRWEEPPLVAFLLTHAIHVFDLMLSVIGPPRDARFHLKPYAGGRYVLSAELASASGTVATATVSTLAPRFVWMAEVLTSAPSVIQVNSPAELIVHAPVRGESPWDRGRRETWRTRSLDSGYDTAGYAAELRAFFDAVETRQEVSPSFDDELLVYDLVQEVLAQRQTAGDSGRLAVRL